MPKVTVHARKRFKQRLGVHKCDTAKNAKRALRDGLSMSEAHGNLHRLMTGVYYRHHANNVRLYRGMVYVFQGDTLITVFGIPERFMEEYNELEKRKEKVKMKKIPTLFERKFKGHKVVGITPNVTPGFEWVLDGDGEATVKYDGSCCAIINGNLYKRYDAKKGKNPPEGAIPCCEPDPVTGLWPHWIRVDKDNPADKWFVTAFTERKAAQAGEEIPDGTYEAVGLHFQGNPYGLGYDYLIRHGKAVIEVPRTFEGIRDYLGAHAIEGIVFWRDGEPQCKIKRTDFGFEWPVTNMAPGKGASK